MTTPALPGPIACELAPAESKRLDEEWRMRDVHGNRVVFFALPVIVVIWGLLTIGLSLDQLRYPMHGDAVATSVGYVLYGSFAVVVYSAKVARRTLPALRNTGERDVVRIAFEAGGVRYERNGTFEFASWETICEAFDLPACIGFTQRGDGSRPFLVPKSALPDGGAALWSYLEVRLTGSRPAIRDLGFAAPKHLKSSNRFAGSGVRV